MLFLLIQHLADGPAHNCRLTDGAQRAAAAVINKLFLQRTRGVAFRVAPPSGTATSMKRLAEAALTKDKNLLDHMETRWDKQQMDAPLRAPAPGPALATPPAPAPKL